MERKMNHSAGDIALKMWGLVGTIIMIPVAVVWKGWFLSIIWGWFAVPIFGLPALSIVQASGVMLVIAYLTPLSIPTPEEVANKKPMILRFMFLVFTTSVLLGVGWIIKTWMGWQ